MITFHHICLRSLPLSLFKETERPQLSSLLLSLPLSPLPLSPLMPLILWHLFQNNLKTQKSAEGKKTKNHPHSQLPESTNIHLSSFLFRFMAVKEIKATDAVCLSPAHSAPLLPLLWRSHTVLGHGFSWGSPSLLHRWPCGNDG